MRDELGLPARARLRAEPHALLVYGKGQFFLPHQDSEKDDTMIGTLVISPARGQTGQDRVPGHVYLRPAAGGRSGRSGPGRARRLRLPGTSPSTNHDDERLSVGFEFGVLGPPMTAAQYPAALTSQFGAEDAAKIEARYPLSGNPSPGLAYASVLTDSQSSCPTLATDTLASRSGVYACEFSDPNPPDDFAIAFGITFPFPPGDAHAAELQYVFGKIPSLDITPPFSAAQLTLSAQMMRYWSRFAATGNPNGGGAPYWPAFDPASPRIEELTSTGTAPQTTFGAYHHCAFWNQIEGVIGR